MSKDRFRDLQNRRRFLIAEPEYLTEHNRCLFLGRQRPAYAREAECYVLANFEREIGLRHKHLEPLDSLRISVCFTLAFQLGLHTPSFLASQMIETDVSSYSEYPGFES